MSSLLHIEPNIKKIHDVNAEFKTEIQCGLEKASKQISSKYLYDARGCELFNKITRHPDYYLTRCELAILAAYKERLGRLIGKGTFNLVELGPGEGIKTDMLMNQFLFDDMDFTYSPIDISADYLQSLLRQYQQKMPHLSLTAIHADYFHGLEWINRHSPHRNVVLFLGSSIGNFDPAATKIFLRHLWTSLHAGDYVLLGFDLRKKIQLLLDAYNDKAGLTREFNLNLLQRINRELAGNINLSSFNHYATYNVHSGAMESYLISLEEQTIYLEALHQTFHFSPFEALHVEYSHKYHFEQIHDLAKATGFTVIENFTDPERYFADSLWQVEK